MYNLIYISSFYFFLSNLLYYIFSQLLWGPVHFEHDVISLNWIFFKINIYILVK